MERPERGPIRAFGWPLVVQAGGLAQLSGARLQLTTAGRKALAAPAAETKQRIYLNSSVPENVVELLCDAPCWYSRLGQGQGSALRKAKGRGWSIREGGLHARRGNAGLDEVQEDPSDLGGIVDELDRCVVGGIGPLDVEEHGLL